MYCQPVCCLRTLGLMTFLVLATYFLVFLRRATACSEPGLRLVDCLVAHFPADLRSHDSTDLKEALRLVALTVVTLVTLGLGAPEAVTLRRGGFPPELAATHSSFHMLSIKIVSTSRAHFSISVHSFNWGHK